MHRYMRHIVLRFSYLNPGKSRTSATPTKLKLTAGGFRKNACIPPTKGIAGNNGFMTILIIPRI